MTKDHAAKVTTTDDVRVRPDTAGANIRTTETPLQ